jgi:hypothetical protein
MRIVAERYRGALHADGRAGEGIREATTAGERVLAGRRRPWCSGGQAAALVSQKILSISAM